MSDSANYKFLDSHEWVDLTASPSPFGISDFAQNELTDIVYVELPELDREYEVGEVIAVVESVKSASDIYAPINCKVIEINEELEADPSLINSAAFTDGWIAKLEATGENEGLISSDEYHSKIA